MNTTTPQQIQAALDEHFRPIDPSAWKHINRIKLSFNEQEYETIRALLQQASDEGMVRVPKAYVDAVSELVEVAELRGECDLPHPADDPRIWTARMQDAWTEIFTQSNALTAADAGEVK